VRGRKGEGGKIRGLDQQQQERGGEEGRRRGGAERKAKG
jgi:hypothetical protein